MSDAIPPTGRSGGGFPITFRDQEYTLNAINDRYRNLYTRWFQRKAIADTLSLRDAYTADRFDKVLASVQRDINAGVYDFGGDACNTVGETADGKVAMFRILFDDVRVSDVMILAMFNEIPEQLNAGWKTLHPESADPKSSTPEKSTLSSGNTTDSPPQSAPN